MSYFKKFTDFCAGFAAFSALMFLLIQWMDFSPVNREGELLEIRAKLKLFFRPKEMGTDYRIYLLLIGILILTLAISIIAKKLPAISFACSLLPLSLVAMMYADGTLSERPMLYFVLSLLFTVGALYECIRCDQESKTTHHAHAAVNLACGIGAIATLVVWIAAKDFAPLPSHKYHYISQRLYESFRGREDPSFLWKIALVLLLTVLLSLLCRELYFLDAAIALIPALWTIFQSLTDGIPILAEPLLTLTLVNLIARIALMLSCRPSEKTDQSP